MTTTIVYLLACDHSGCERTAAKDNSAGWTDAIYTHGCPAHGEVIAAHQAKVTDVTRGRGARERTTWYLVCACGWRPSPNFQTHSAAGLKRAHLAHVREETA